MCPVNPEESPLTYMFTVNPWPATIIIVALIVLGCVAVWRLLD